MKATAEQREAVAVINGPQPDTIDDALKMGKAVSTLAKAWIDAHPDDDEELASWEWLRDVMGWAATNEYVLRYPCLSADLMAVLNANGELAIGCWSYGTPAPFMFNPTRRQVRLLREALGDGKGKK